MTDAQTDQPITLVLKNTAGDYFVVSQAILEQCRLPAERAAELEQLLANADGDVRSRERAGGRVTPASGAHVTHRRGRTGP